MMDITPSASASQTPPGTGALPRAQLAADKETAEKFEAVFLGQMTQLMMESVDTGDQFSGGHGEAMFRGILAEKLGNAMAQKGGIGLAPAVLAQIIKLQGGTGNGE